MSRHSSAPAFSMFAFMDIITSTIGIIFLIIILLALDLLTRVETETVASQTNSAQNENVLAQLQSRADRLQKQIVEISSATAVEKSPDNAETEARQIASLKNEIERLIAENAQFDRPDETGEKLRNQISAADQDIVKSREQIAAVKNEITTVEEKVTEIREQIAQQRRKNQQAKIEHDQKIAKANRNPPRRIVTLPGENTVKKKIVVVQPVVGGIKAVELTDGAKMKKFSGEFFTAFAEFKKWAEQFPARQDYYFLIYVPTNAYENAMKIVEWIQPRGFYACGYEPITAGVDAVYDQTDTNKTTNKTASSASSKTSEQDEP